MGMNLFGRIRRVFVQRTETTITTTSRAMTPEEQAAFEAAFKGMDEMFDRLDKVFTKRQKPKT